MKRAAAIALLLAGCDKAAPPSPEPVALAGPALEAAAVRRGIVADPRARDAAGLYVGETDTVCVVPRAADGYVVGALVDYGEGQGCVARGTATPSGSGTLAVVLGPGCRFSARTDGDRIVFPAVLPDDCDRSCRGRASLSALSAPRLSTSESEARSSITPDGSPLCG